MEANIHVYGVEEITSTQNQKLRYSQMIALRLISMTPFLSIPVFKFSNTSNMKHTSMVNSKLNMKFVYSNSNAILVGKVIA